MNTVSAETSLQQGCKQFVYSQRIYAINKYTSVTGMDSAWESCNITSTTLVKL